MIVFFLHILRIGLISVTGTARGGGARGDLRPDRLQPAHPRGDADGALIQRDVLPVRPPAPLDALDVARRAAVVSGHQAPKA